MKHNEVGRHCALRLFLCWTKKISKLPAFVGERLHLCLILVLSLPAVVHIVLWGHLSVASFFILIFFIFLYFIFD